MKFHVNRDVFSEAVSFVVKLLPQRNPQPILAGVLIEASDDGLVARRRSTTRHPLAPTIEADVDEPGTILVSGRLLVRDRQPAARTRPIQVEVDEDGGIVRQLRLRALHPAHRCRCRSTRRSPRSPASPGSCPAEDFATAIAQVAFAASRDDVTPVLTGVQLEVRGNSLSLVATDRYRVALREIPWDGGGDAQRRADHRARPGAHPHRGRQDLRARRRHLDRVLRLAATARSSRSPPATRP